MVKRVYQMANQSSWCPLG